MVARLVLRLSGFRDRLARGDVTSVEGTVQDFVPQQGNPIRSERFRIGDHEFAYRDEEHAPGYHTLRANGGVITDGLVLRIADIDGRIARIELIELQALFRRSKTKTRIPRISTDESS
jgi:hypothetical protein